MPILIPIPGADEAPSGLPTIFVSRGSIRIANVSVFEAGGSIDVTSTGTRAALGSIGPTAVESQATRQSIRPVNIDTNRALASCEVVAGDSFLILANILASNISGPNLGSFGYTEINAELLVNNVPIPIKSFDYQVPAGRLGSILNIRLAVPDVATVPAGASVKFSLKVRVGGVLSSYTLLDNGKLQQRDYQISYRGGNSGGPTDEISFSSLDVISDKFSLAPRRPVVMFDPYRVRYDQVQVRNDQMVTDPRGNKIVPLVEPVAGLSMRRVLQRAYTGIGGAAFITVPSQVYGWSTLMSGPATDQHGCGFTGVITNIPDYKVRRVDFTLENGWHAGAQPTVMMYSPVYFVENNVLYIMDVEQPLPYGVVPHQVTLASHKVLSERIEYKPDSNAVLLTYQYNGNDPSEDPAKQYRDVFTETVESVIGERGNRGYSQTTVRRWDREVFMPDRPTDVLDTFPLSSETETEQSVTWYYASGDEQATYTRVTHRETIDYLYEGDLKIQHVKTTYAAVADPATSFTINMFPVEIETCDISWMEDPNNPGVKLQSSVRTDVWGRCAYNPNNTETVVDSHGTVLFVRMIPVLIAQSSGILSSEWVISNNIPISSTRMTLHKGKGNQFDVEVIEIDHLNNTLRKSYTEPVTGTNSNDPFEARSRTVLLRDTVSEAAIGPRIPLGINAYELPRDRAIKLGQRALYRLSNPLMTMPLTLAGVDFTIARGTVIKGQKRSGGYTSNYFVTGYTISGNELGKTGHRVTQTIESVEIGSPLPNPNIYIT